MDGIQFIDNEKFQRLSEEEATRWAGVLERLSAYDGPPRKESSMATAGFVLEFDSRPDQGPMWIGPFDTAEAADREALRITGGVGEWSWSVVPLTAPEES